MSSKNQDVRAKYVKTYEKTGDPQECKDKLCENFLKDEMLTLAESNGLEVNKNQTKKEIAEKLIDTEVYEEILGGLDKPKEKSKEKKETRHEIRHEPPGFHDLLNPLSEMISGSTLAGSKRLNELWLNSIEDIEDNLDDIVEHHMDHWKDIEKEWESRAKEFQDEVNELRESSALPQEKTKELSVIWRNVFNKMSARVKRLSRRTKERQDVFYDMVDKHVERARDTLEKSHDEKTVPAKILALSSDFTKDLRREMKETVDAYQTDHREMVEIWENFAGKTENIIQELREDQEENIGDLYDIWNSNMEFVGDNIKTSSENYIELYESMVTDIEDQGRNITKTLFDISEKLEENYYDMLESYTKTLEDGYGDMFSMLSLYGDGPKDINALKERGERLEEKLEED